MNTFHYISARKTKKGRVFQKLANLIMVGLAWFGLENLCYLMCLLDNLKKSHLTLLG